MINRFIKPFSKVKSMFDKSVLVAPARMLCHGRTQRIAVPERHYVNHHPMLGSNGELDRPEGCQQAMFGLGCFWGQSENFGNYQVFI